MNTKVRNIAIFVIAVFVIVMMFISIFTLRPAELESGYRLVMGTFAHVIVVAKDTNTCQKCIEAAFAAMDRVDALMSDYKTDSEISLINQNAAEYPVQVGESTFEVLQRSVEFSKMTDGAFDITVGPLVDLFRSAKESHIAPDQEQIDKAKSKVGYEKLILDSNNRTVKFAVDGMRLDLGGIAKGYGIDKAIKAIQSAGALGAMVDVGGDVRCFGVPSKGKKNWLVGIQDPNLNLDTPNGNIILKLKIADGAVATSGDYQQFVIIKGKKYSHIINRRTGTSAEGLSSVTIIADNATDADALATAVSVMGAEKGLALIEKLPDTEAILIPTDTKHEIIKTSGAGKYCVNDPG
jgi:thiamine biosynthesis lipoprotein